ncbi:hypothetical protein PL263_05185 [Methylomonas sp. EFPC3]|uniref:hypothetical protein n=1 Tax=Methylomonas sp. EFPC3 TaxID=3021710 RepID=UPI0024175213|nr:hypothetical protein [Methylomonas sp. EFPC3]WFP51424.1 hypothetical protein PL263_05185 [Methylomonas sp. EFPC3]
MPKLYCRVNPRTDIEKRDRAGQRFTRNWRELDGMDDATVAALQEDPYLEVTDKPTVLVEVAATSQAGAIETEQGPNNPVKSEATDEGSTGETAAEGTDTGTASPVANTADADLGNENPVETGPEADGSEGLATTDEIKTGDDAPAADAADAGADGTAATDGEQPANTAEKTAAELRIEQIKGAIEVLNPNVAENWLGDGRPATKAIELILGAPLSPVSAAERDAIWAEIQSARSAG